MISAKQFVEESGEEDGLWGVKEVKKGEEGKLRVQTLHCINPLFTGRILGEAEAES